MDGRARAGPARRNAPARCSPCGARSRSPDGRAPSRVISRSRVTLATIEAAAIDSTSASPRDHRLAVAAAVDAVAAVDEHELRPHRQRRDRARQRPQRGAQDVVAVDARGRAERDRDLRRWRRSSRRASRASSASSFLESLSPRGMRLGSRMTAAATTGPASGPRPASSQPATGQTPLASARARAGTSGAAAARRAAGGALHAESLWRLIWPCARQCARSPQSQRWKIIASENRGLGRTERCGHRAAVHITLS